jgi:hypothetical protein
MPWVGFEPMIPVFARAKTFHGLDRAATEIGISYTGYCSIELKASKLLLLAMVNTPHEPIQHFK